MIWETREGSRIINAKLVDDNTVTVNTEDGQENLSYWSSSVVAGMAVVSLQDCKISYEEFLPLEVKSND